MNHYALVVDVAAPADVYDATHAELAASASGPPFPPPRVEEFAVHGLVVPAAGIAT